MAKTITIGLVALAFAAGSVLTGTIAFADGDDDDLTYLLCPISKALTGLILEDDDEIVDVVCGEQEGAEVVQSIERTSGMFLVEKNKVRFGRIDCSSNEIVSGGGYIILDPRMEVLTSSQNGNGWLIQVRNTSPIDQSFIVKATCLS